MKNKIPYIILLISITCSVWYYRANTKSVQIPAKLERIEYDSWFEVFTGYFTKDNYMIRQDISFDCINNFKLGKTYYITLTKKPDGNFFLSMFGLLIFNAAIFLFFNRERL